MDKNKKTHKLLCIVCPEGCEIETTEIDGEFKFEKEICKRGQDYARQEIINPCRYLTTTVRLKGGNQAMLPVRTSAVIPKGKLIEAMNQIAALEITAPIKLGDIICDNITDTGVTLIASKTIQRQ
jgi:CxxC motif-containing protein